MHPHLFKIGPLTVQSYGFMIALGAIVTYYVLCTRANKKKIETEVIDSLVIWMVVGVFLGAKILYWLTQIPEIIANPMIIFNIAEGYVIYGGLIGGILAIYLFCKMMQLSFLTVLDLVAPSVALLQGFGRIGCFFAGCCYGMESTSFLAVIFPPESIGLSGVSLFPIQLVSSLLDFIHFAILIYLSKVFNKQGQLASAYLIFYSIGRFILEFFRGDLIRGSVGALTTSQFISIWMALFGILLWIIAEKKADKVIK